MYINKSYLSEIVNKLKNNELDIIDYINNICNLIEANEQQIQALLPEKNRRQRLLNDAKKLQEFYPNTKSRPNLYGALVGVKDIFIVDGFETKAGSNLPSTLFEGEEASCVTKLKQVGALILGKTVTTEFAYFEPGPTRNPYNINHTPGGSSSGSAASVAIGYCPLSFGTQTIGSITRPAAFCGIIGFKPSYSRIDTDGVIPFSESADHVGFFTQNVKSVSLVASILCNKWKENITLKKDKFVFGVPTGKYLNQADKDTLIDFDKQIKLLQGSGHIIKELKMFDDIDEINQIHRDMISFEIAEVHKNWFEKYEDLYRLRTKEIILKGKQISEDTIEKAKAGQIILRNHIENIMNEHKIDLWVTPSAIGEATEGIETTGNPIMNLPWTYTGFPTITIPVGKLKKQLPIGLQFVSRFMKDEELLLMIETIASIYGVE